MKICYRFAVCVCVLGSRSAHSSAVVFHRLRFARHCIAFSPSSFAHYLTVCIGTASLPFYARFISMHFNNFPNDLSEHSEHRRPQNVCRAHQCVTISASTSSWGFIRFTVLWLMAHASTNHKYILFIHFSFPYLSLSLSHSPPFAYSSRFCPGKTSFSTLHSFCAIAIVIFKYSFRISINFQW